MRTPLRLALRLACGLLLASAAAADDAAPAAAEDARALHRLPAAGQHPVLLPQRALLAPTPIDAEDEPSLADHVELSLRGLAGPHPADPRRHILTGDLWLRVPLGARFDLRPGMRIEYERDPIVDLRVGEPMAIVSLSLRF